MFKIATLALLTAMSSGAVACPTFPKNGISWNKEEFQCLLKEQYERNATPPTSTGSISSDEYLEYLKVRNFVNSEIKKDEAYNYFFSNPR